MQIVNWLKLSKYQQLSVIILTIVLGAESTADAQAGNLDANFVLNGIAPEKRYVYVAGMIEGLAYSRFLRDKPNEEGMICIRGWLDDEPEKNWEKIRFFFERHPDKPPAVLLHVLIKKECGE